ncbi:hypothetical protein QP162_11840 [Sphingomonas aurantiaca]|uniref:hypothetical protein n=1 Tax=Sphingomonas aurantiaca TaxID=185949 RepID=UPI002FE423C3
MPPWMAGAGRTIECWLEAERDQLVLWLPVMLGGGIALWFALPDAAAWRSAILGLVAIGLACVATGRGGRAARVLALGMAAAALGLGLIWFRAETVAAPVLGGPMIASFSAKVEVIEPLVARRLMRLTLLPVGEGRTPRGTPSPCRTGSASIWPSGMRRGAWDGRDRPAARAAYAAAPAGGTRCL